MAKREPKNINEHSDALTTEINKLNRHKKRLEKILEETKKSLCEVTHLKLFPLEDELHETIEILTNKSRNLPTIVILGTAKARAVNFILGENILPSLPQPDTLCNNWRGIRIRYGSKRQYKFSLDADTEVIESNNLDSNWDQIPNKKLNRNDSIDFSTILDIELCNQFLKSGVQIIIPPDLEDPSFENNSNVVHNYQQWSLILQEIFPIIINSLDESEYIKFTKLNSIPKFQNSENKNIPSKSNILSTLQKKNLNYKSPKNDSNINSKFYIDCESESENESQKPKSDKNLSNNTVSDSNDLPLLKDENLLYLSQICEYHPNSSVLFLLFPESIGKFINSSEIPSCSSKIMDDPNYSSESQSSSASGQTEFSDTFSDDQDYDSIHKTRKIFLDTLIQQLHSLVNTLHVENSFLGHGLIIDDENFENPSLTINPENSHKTYKVGNVMQRLNFIEYFAKFAKRSFQNFMLNDCNKISKIHNSLLQQFILSSYDMAREMQIIPKKIKYVAETEQELFDTLNKTFSDGEKREELMTIMQKILQDMKNNFEARDYPQSSSSNHNSTECFNLTLASSIFYTTPFIANSMNSRKSITKNGEKVKEFEIENSLDLNDYYIITRSGPSTANSSPAPEPDENVQNEASEAEVWFNDNSSRVCSISNILDFRDDILNTFNKNLCSASVTSRSSIGSFKEVSLDIQRAVLAKLSRNISIHLVKFVDCLKDSYFGTLQRCLDSLEEGRCKRSASEAVRQILLVTNTVDLQYCASFSFLHALMDQLRRFFNRLSLFPNANRSCCSKSPEWRREVALNTIESLSALKLAKLISSQLKEKIRVSHEKFQKALEALNEHHSIRLSQTEEIKLAVRKLYAPRFARLCLESTSLRDLIKHGLPRLGKEIGRGQYGVVFSLKGSWGGYEICAVKSVLPPDERHFNELAMEFYHTRNIPPHDRIVKLWGSVIDYSYLDGSPSVLLISERLKWDLHCALLVAQMSLHQRMQITVDIVEGIRYLHAQGLVHRDIKLKNVLLDDNNRAKLTDLGFCIPEAMISGSIVGTPIHMAPELLMGVYDSTVDVYAFGILFWYLCAGSVKLPAAYDSFSNKEQLWNSVKRGLRPEKLSQFSDIAWELMEKCWAKDPSKRPLLGDVQPIVESIRDNSHPDVDDPLNPLCLFAI